MSYFYNQARYQSTMLTRLIYNFGLKYSFFTISELGFITLKQLNQENKNTCKDLTEIFV